jgi:hypothetical protein
MGKLRRRYISVSSRHLFLPFIEAPLTELFCNRIAPSLVPFDHIYPSTTKHASSQPTAVLYADPFSSSFQPLHRRLSELALDSHAGNTSLQYVLRWKPLVASGDSFLAGYGAALDLKKVDYLVIDDRKLTETSAMQGGDEDKVVSVESKQLLQDQSWMKKLLKTSKDDEKQSIGSLEEHELSGE